MDNQKKIVLDNLPRIRKLISTRNIREAAAGSLEDWNSTLKKLQTKKYPFPKRLFNPEEYRAAVKTDHLQIAEAQAEIKRINKDIKHYDKVITALEAKLNPLVTDHRILESSNYLMDYLHPPFLSEEKPLDNDIYFKAPKDINNFYGKIDFLGSNGKVGETLYYSDYDQYKKEIKDSVDCGRPFSSQHISKTEYDEATAEQGQYTRESISNRIEAARATVEQRSHMPPQQKSVCVER